MVDEISDLNEKKNKNKKQKGRKGKKENKGKKERKIDKVETDKKEYTFPIKDGRMFEDELLYCEGRHKPLLRGFIHLFGLCSGIIPLGLFEIIKIAQNDTILIILACCYFISNFICYFISSLFHILKWPSNVEIVLQKIDHIMVCLYCVVTIVLWSYALFPLKIQLPLSISSLILLCINIYKIYNCEPSLLIQSLTGLVSILYIPFFYAYTTKREFAFAGTILLLATIGVILFIKEIDIPFIDNTILGHHEIFHLLLAIVGLIGYFMLHSIIYRRCNGIACD
jgi:channel protein (hemolysin III family)